MNKVKRVQEENNLKWENNYYHGSRIQNSNISHNVGSTDVSRYLVLITKVYHLIHDKVIASESYPSFSISINLTDERIFQTKIKKHTIDKTKGAFINYIKQGVKS
uniref:Uncharacterized protein n=1 Tax=Cacopsylla melanoneura TaxID=428564 RepID=A0A8D9E8L1_9HEMI